jgi:hypothetical protein
MSRHGTVERAHVKWTLLEAPHYTHTDPVGRRKFHALARCESMDAGVTWTPYVVTVEFFEDHLPQPPVAETTAEPAEPKAKAKRSKK